MWSKVLDGERWIFGDWNRPQWEGVFRDLSRNRVSAVGKKEI